MRAALTHNNPADRGLASRTVFALFTVDLVAQLKAPFLPRTVHVVGNRRAAGLDGFKQDLPDRAMQPGSDPTCAVDECMTPATR